MGEAYIVQPVSPVRVSISYVGKILLIRVGEYQGVSRNPHMPLAGCCLYVTLDPLTCPPSCPDDSKRTKTSSEWSGTEFLMSADHLEMGISGRRI